MGARGDACGGAGFLAGDCAGAWAGLCSGVCADVCATASGPAIHTIAADKNATTRRPGRKRAASRLEAKSKRR